METTDILGQICRLFLAFSHDTVVIPLTVIGYIWLKRETFFQAICLLLFSMIFNTALKVTFQVPLSPALGQKGFAFPSGHMQTSVTFYGWLYRSTRSYILRALIVTLFVGIGSSLIYFDYHNIIDIIGGIAAGLLLLYVYSNLYQQLDQISFSMILISTASILMYYIAFSYHIPPHLWMGYYSLLGLLVAQYYFENDENNENKKDKLVATVVCFLILALISVMFANIKQLIHFLPLKWLLTGMSIPCAISVAHKLKK